MALIALAVGLFPASARAEIVGSSGDGAVLAVGPLGVPTVASLDERDLLVSTRVAAGVWRTSRVRLPVPASESSVVSSTVARDGRPAVLVVDLVRRTVVLAWRRPSRWLVVRVARVAGDVELGFPGLALDRNGHPVVAYALRQASGKTFLRLARVNTKGRTTTEAITKLGFPDSGLPPSTVPVVMPGGGIRVVETFTSAVIVWFRDGKTWRGQFIFASRLGSPVGRVLALTRGSQVVSAWTQDYPSLDETHPLVQDGPPDGMVFDVLSHAHLAALTLASGRPEIAANDWVDIDGWTTFAALVVAPETSEPPVELDGRIDGYAAVGRQRQLLIATERGLEWLVSPGPLGIRVSLTVDGSGNASGHVDGAASGTVELYRDAPDTGRVLVATAPIAPDGSYSAKVPASPVLYRAVYRDPLTGIPYASLLRR